MRLVTYTPDRFDALATAARAFAQRTRLGDRSFVEFYYGSSERCELHLALDDDENVVATLGIELMPFETSAGPMTLGAGSNFHSLRPGVGGLLFHLWLSRCDAGLVFGGSDDTHRILGGRGWSYFPGIRGWWLERPLETRADESLPRRVAKSALRSVRRLGRTPLDRRAATIPDPLRERFSVRAERAWAPDLVPATSPFRFRFAPDAEHLAWRYALDLPFASFRLFRILDGGRSAGYVVLRDAGEGVVVAQADADSVDALAAGVLSSLVVPRGNGGPAYWAVLTTCHARLAEIYRAFGFIPEARERPFALGTLRGGVDLDPDTTTWLVNREWADIGFIPGGSGAA